MKKKLAVGLLASTLMLSGCQSITLLAMPTVKDTMSGTRSIPGREMLLMSGNIAIGGH